MSNLNSMQCVVCGRKIDWPLEHFVQEAGKVFCVPCHVKRCSDAWLDELEVCANMELRGVSA